MRVNRDNKNLIITFVYNPALVDIVGKIGYDSLKELKIDLEKETINKKI